MNAPEKLFLPDVQSSPDERQIVIQKVGVKSIRHPIQIQLSNGPQATIAQIDMTVRLAAHLKGTHMSRFLEILQSHHAALDYESLKSMMESMLNRLEADAGHITIAAPIFINKVAPISKVESLLDYDVVYTLSSVDGVFSLEQEVRVPVTSLCPCSKKISDYGAHNQRSLISMKTKINQAMPIERLIDIAENAASCQLWGLLKRPDEKYVTEYAYDNPKFVEDLVRDIAVQLQKIPEVSYYEVSSENFESIHNHSAYAWLCGPQQ